MTWPYPHPPRGTCVPGCEAYGLCHCGCGRAARVHRSPTDHRRGYDHGRPYVHLAGHSPAHAAWSRRGIAVEKVRPLVRWLIGRYGRQGTASLLGVPERTLNTVVYSRAKRYVTPELARRVVDVVLAHRRPTQPWDTFELPSSQRRLAVPVEPSRGGSRGGTLVPLEEVRPLVERLVARCGGVVAAGQQLSAHGGGDPLNWVRWLHRVREGRGRRVLSGRRDVVLDALDQIGLEEAS